MNVDQQFQKYKNEANMMLQDTMEKFEKHQIARLIFTERMNKVVLMYDKAPVYFGDGEKMGQEDPIKVSSIEKNKAFAYKALLTKYQEIYYTGDDQLYDQELNMLQMYLERMTDCLNKALYYGVGAQDDKWYAGVIQFSVSLIDNKIFKTYYRQEKSAFKIRAYEAMYNKINKSNYDALRRLCWKLAKSYFKLSISEQENKQYQNALDCVDNAIQFLQRSQEVDHFIKESKALQSQNYYASNRFKSPQEFADLLDELRRQHLRCQSWREMEQAQKVLTEAMQAEQYNMDAIMDAVDQFKFSMSLTQDKDLEVEAIAAAHLGRIFYRCFHKADKAGGYFKQSLRICEALKPKTFFQVRWYQNMMRDMDDINKAAMKAEPRESEDEQKMRIELKKEIDEMWDKKAQGAVPFLQFVIAQYKNWKGESIQLSDDDLKAENLKQTLVKTVYHYHPDRQKQDKDGIYTPREVYLRKEITKIINNLNADLKL